MAGSKLSVCPHQPTAAPTWPGPTNRTWACFHSSVAKSVAHTHSTPYIISNDNNYAHPTQTQEPDNYEDILENLRLSIQSRQARLSEIRLRERRMTLVLTSYAFAAWALYLALWFLGWLPDVHGRHSSTPTLRKAAFGAPVVIGPIMYVAPGGMYDHAR